MRTFLPLLILLAGIGCQNPCQQICADMATFAREECGLTVTEAEIGQCEAEQSAANGETRSVCREGNSVDDISTIWACDDVADFFPEG